MVAIITFLIGLAGGAVVVLVLFIEKQRQVAQEKIKQSAQAVRIRQTLETLKLRSAELAVKQTEFDARLVTYEDLRRENQECKKDLHNIDVNQRKLQLDFIARQQAQDALDARVKSLGSRYLKDMTKWIGSSLTTNNFVSCKQRQIDVIQRCRDIGFTVSQEEEESLLADLKEQFENAVRNEFQRQEQARIKEQIREEERIQREADREVARLERERAVIQAALQKALEKAHNQYSEEVEALKAKLAEAEEKAKRAVSQAQLTKAGHVYVISNIGSFGENVFKIGLTRRLEPQDRVRELGDSSVPFPFDVHMMIASENAPALENAIHRAFHKSRLNKVKPRKEFYRCELDSIRRIVEENHGEVQFVAEPEALEYRQSLSASEEDSEYIDQVYERVIGQTETPND